jgi:hypothetical protein
MPPGMKKAARMTQWCSKQNLLLRAHCSLGSRALGASGLREITSAYLDD